MFLRELSNLGDVLAGLDRQRRVLIGELAEGFRCETLARHFAHRAEHGHIARPARGDLAVDHQVPEAGRRHHSPQSRVDNASHEPWLHRRAIRCQSLRRETAERELSLSDAITKGLLRGHQPEHAHEAGESGAAQYEPQSAYCHDTCLRDARRTAAKPSERMRRRRDCMS